MNSAFGLTNKAMVFTIVYMRSLFRTLGAPTARNIALVCLADALVGLSFGAIAVGSGLPVWLPMLIGFVVFAGSSQFVFVSLVTSGGNPFAAMVAGLLVNSRHIPFGFSIGDVMEGPWYKQVFGAHLMVDEATAFTMTATQPHRRRAVYWTTAILLFFVWNITVVLGSLSGSLITNTDALGLDAAFPAVLIALLLPSLKDWPIVRAAAGAAVIALVTSTFLPAGLPVLLSLAAALLAWPRKDDPQWADDADLPGGPDGHPSGGGHEGGGSSGTEADLGGGAA